MAIVAVMLVIENKRARDGVHIIIMEVTWRRHWR